MLNINIVETGRPNDLVETKQDFVLLDTIDDDKGHEFFILTKGALQSVVKISEGAKFACLGDGLYFRNEEGNKNVVLKFDTRNIEETNLQCDLGLMGKRYQDFYLSYRENEYGDEALFHTVLSDGTETNSGDWMGEFQKVGENIICKFDDEIFAVSTSFERLWSYRIDSRLIRNHSYNCRLDDMFCFNGNLVFVSGFNDKEGVSSITSLCGASGDVLWSSEVTGKISSFVVDESNAIILTTEQISIMDMSTGEIKNRSDASYDNGTAFFVGEFVLVASRLKRTIKVLSLDLEELIADFELDSNYSVNSDTRVVKAGNCVFITLSSVNQPLSKGFQAVACIGLAESDKVEVTKQARLYEIKRLTVEAESCYELELSNCNEKDLKRYLELGLKEIVSRYGSDTIYVNDTQDKKHLGKILIKYDASTYSDEINEDMRKISKATIEMFHRVGMSPGAGKYPEYKFSVEYSS